MSLFFIVGPVTDFVREGVKKTIESVIMIIPRRTPPPLFFENFERLSFFIKGMDI